MPPKPARLDLRALYVKNGLEAAWKAVDLRVVPQDASDQAVQLGAEVASSELESDDGA